MRKEIIVHVSPIVNWLLKQIHIDKLGSDFFGKISFVFNFENGNLTYIRRGREETLKPPKEF